MTIIVGVKNKDGIWIGADSNLSSGYHSFSDQPLYSKVFKNGEFLFAATGSCRGSNILQHSFNIPAPSSRGSVDSYIYGPFLDAMRKCFKDNGFLSQKDSFCERAAVAGLFAYKKRLFLFDNDFCIIEQKIYAAHGCGREYAYGSLYTTNQFSWDPQDQIKHAINAANNFSVYCGGKIKIIKA